MLLRLLLLLLLFAFFVLLRSQVQASNFCGFIHLMGDGYLKLAISMETLMINPGIWFFLGCSGDFQFGNWSMIQPLRPIQTVLCQLSPDGTGGPGLNGCGFK
jgi:hypothetical protein